MRKQITAGLLILALSAGVGNAAASYTPTPKAASYTPTHKISVHQTSFAQQVRSIWNHMFAWL